MKKTVEMMVAEEVSTLRPMERLTHIASFSLVCILFASFLVLGYGLVGALVAFFAFPVYGSIFYCICQSVVGIVFYTMSRTLAELRFWAQ